MKFSSKPTTYIIDGLNFVRSFMMEHHSSEDEVTRDFFDWIYYVAESDAFYTSSFRIIFDGSFRGSGPLLRGNVKVTYAEGVSADELIAEQALYLFGKEERVCVVTSDRGLKEEIAVEGVKTMYCDAFYKAARSAADGR